MAKKQHKKSAIYIPHLITRKVSLPFHAVGGNLKENILQTLINLEGKCIGEGYVQRNSVKVMTHSSGILRGKQVLFDVVFEARICHPVEGMKIRCIIKNVTKAGIRAETDEEISPIVVFIARDHYYNNDYFTKCKERDHITIKVIGIRYELNDKYVSVVADLCSDE